MRPPVLARALVAAVAPARDYEIVAGDLNEEYLRIMDSRGAKAAKRWYWAQTLLSMPALLSYSRSNGSALRRVSVPLIALGVLCAMLCVLTAIATVFESLFGIHRVPACVELCVNYACAIGSGAMLARLVRSDGLRIAFAASVFLVLCFVIPALAGNPPSQAPLAAWIQLAGAVPTMCLGAGLYQAVSRRIDSAN